MWRAAGVALLLAGMAGCGKGPSSSLAEVSGTVTFDGKPVSGVVVTFYPMVEKGEPRLAFSRAISDAAGKFTLIAEGDKPGAVVAKHKVVVNWPARSGHEVAAHPDPFVMPVPYTTVSETPLEREVKAGQNDIPIDLKRQ
jgi:hypothetical protein